MACEGHIETARFLMPATGQTIHILPQSLDEVQFIYSEIFESEAYSKHGAVVQPGDVVVDVGANIGMFFLHAASQAAAAHATGSSSSSSSSSMTSQPVTYYGFEALPPVFEVLHRNVVLGMQEIVNVKALLNVALGEQVRANVPFTLFPRLPGNSTFNVVEKMRLQRGIVEPHVYEGATEYLVSMRTLSDIMEEHAIERIDYLKVDVEGAELMVLKGIKDAHWSRIWQVVVEVPNADEEIDKNGTLVLVKRANVVIDLFKKHGFEVNVEVTPISEDSMIYARRSNPCQGLSSLI